MKTTVEINDALIARAKEICGREGLTLRQLIEGGLRRELEERGRRAPFRLRDASVTGNGLRPELADGGWERLRDAAYEGRGA